MWEVKWGKLIELIAKKEGKAMQQRAFKNSREGAYWGLLYMGHQQEKLHTIPKLLEINLYLKQNSAQMLNYRLRKTVEM